MGKIGKHGMRMGAELIGDKYSERIAVALRPSRGVRWFVVVGASLTVVLVWSIPLRTAWAILATTWILLAAIDALRRSRAASLEVACSGEVVVGGVPGTVADGSFVSPWFVVLRWRPAGARLERCLPVAPDTLSPASFRILRVLLRFGDRPLGPLSQSEKRTKWSVPESRG